MSIELETRPIDSGTSEDDDGHLVCRDCHAGDVDFYVSLCGSLIRGDEPIYEWGKDGTPTCGPCLILLRCPLCGIEQQLFSRGDV